MASTSIRKLLALCLCTLPMAAAAKYPVHEYPPYMNKVLLAHGIMACLAWVILFPLGGILIRLCNFNGLFYTHVGIQLLAYVMFCVVFGTGCWFAWLYGTFINMHVIIGMIVFILATIQPFLGSRHHYNFKKYSRRTWSSLLHIHLGRALVTIAMINGGLGLYIAENASPAQIQAYGAVAGIVWLSYILIVSFKESMDVEAQYERSLSSDVESLDEEKADKESMVGTIEERNLGVYE